MNSQDKYEQIGVAMTCRSFEEYTRMFDLDDRLLGSGPILDVAGGASSFTAEARGRGFEAFAADPQYALSADDMEEQGRREIDVSTAKLAALQHKFDWTYYGSIERHRGDREQSLTRFMADYRADRNGRSHGESVNPAGGRTDIYTAGLLPQLPYADHTFSLVLCSHFLFLYQAQFSHEFHLEAVRELLRVCRPGGEVRIYPLLSLKWEGYPRMNELLAGVESMAGRMEMLPSKLPFIPGSTTLLRLMKS
ncbi:methyltransferase domain-containing protein [Paenibacillus sp. y28]|uniref:methyltransferase domain-containing protein n=1 Tax=Paenibacillus sp. y28 TaxID=3129110 RepID=UPI00301B3C22